jgi:DNA-binding beta-propeller fold protein YncE
VGEAERAAGIHPGGGRGRRRRLGVALSALVAVVVGGAGATLWRTPPPAEPVEVAASPATTAPATIAPPYPDRAVREPLPERAPTPVQTHRFVIDTHPPGAAVVITTPEGDVHRGETPFRYDVPAGAVDLEVALDGYQTISDTVDVAGDVAVEWWLGPPGLLHRSVGGFSTGSNPKQVAFTPDGTQIWVSLLGGQGVEVFDAATFERLAEINLGQHGAVEIIFAPDGAAAYASQMETASVYEIDTADLEVRRQLMTEGTWSKVMALSPDASTLYVSNWTSDDVSEIDLVSGEVRRRLPTVRNPRGLYPTEDGERLFVAGFGHGELARIDLAEGTSQVLLSTGGAMRHLVGDGKRLYAGDMATAEVYVVDLETEETHKLADTNAKPNTIDLSPDGRVLYVSNRGRNNPESYYLPGPEWGSVLAFDTATGDPLDAIVGGNQTTGLAVASDGSAVAFSDFLDNRVSVYEIPGYDALAAGGGGRFEAHRDELAK